MARASVAGIRTFVAGSKDKPVHVGIDVHKRSYSVALLRSDGAWKEWTTPSSPEALEQTLSSVRSRIGARLWSLRRRQKMAIRKSTAYRIGTWCLRARMRKGLFEICRKKPPEKTSEGHR